MPDVATVTRFVFSETRPDGSVELQQQGGIRPEGLQPPVGSETARGEEDNVLLALTLGFGTLFFSCAVRGEVWFTAEVLGVGLTALYLRNATGVRRPALAGLFYSMAVLTRTPLVFSGIFFLMECFCPGPTGRWEQLRALGKSYREPLRKLGSFALGAAPLALAATKKVIVESADWSSAEAWKKQQDITLPVFMSKDAQEGPAAFAEKRKPNWKGE